MIPRKPKDPPDVCLVLEGTYPYVSGGVSTWVHQIISAMPELRFSVLFIGAEKAKDAKYAYKLPSNIVSVEEAYLFARHQKWLTAPVSAAEILTLTQKCRALFAAEGTPSETDAFSDLLGDAAKLARRTSIDSIWKDAAVWDLISEIYDEHAADAPFLDFFWACRFLAEPVWNLLGGLSRVPVAKLYHSPCTGYAGVIAALLARQNGAPFLLSEHGIYVRERIAEIHKVTWLQDAEFARPNLLPDDSVLRSMWIRFFTLLARYSYNVAGHITALFTANARHQISFGAPAQKIEIIPNGIALSDFDSIVKKREIWRSKRDRPVVGFLGRVVGIKDIKTLLQSAVFVRRLVPDVQFLIAGPTSEEPEYFKECALLSQRLGLEDVVIFAGPMDRGELLAQIDVMALTSISEGLPFVVLEAFGASIPVVSTDVGACPDLINGQPDEHPALGAAGTVTRVGDPQAMAQAMVEILVDPQKARELGSVGRARVEACYTQQAVVDRFRTLYTEPLVPTISEPLTAPQAAG
ncbi:MAG: GT4 family glycosyltransferase PelF [Verrucomicrobiae bacterium]|nr:GT4 family glycosyltransferase PelF [Verrucomicrobiae bacterium]